MVQAVVNINKRTNRILNIVKAQFELRNKSETIEKVVDIYSRGLMEPRLRPEFVEKLKRLEKQKAIPVKNFAKRYGLK